MKYIDEFRDKEKAQEYIRAIRKIARRQWRIMEVCGGQTHAIVRFGIDSELKDQVELIHGPGCPVCVTPVEMIDRALAIARMKHVIFSSFGDMLRVPGSHGDLFSVKASGGDVRMVYSPLDALELARRNPEKEVVFFGVGFETTAPANAMAVYQARKQNIRNFSMLVSHVLVPPAMAAVLSSPSNRVQGFLAAGHVCTVMGTSEYEPIARQYRVPMVVTGFEPLDILQGLWMCVRQLEEGRFDVENQYARSVRRQGNQEAQRILAEVFCVIPRKWRGIGEIPQSGLGLAPAYRDWDAEKNFSVRQISAEESGECISGLILQGLKKPFDCPAFGTRCTPERPLGATMVSNEGACSAYYRYRQPQLEEKIL